MPFDFDFSATGGGGQFSDPGVPDGVNRGSLSGSITVTTPPVLTGPCAVSLEAPDPDALATLPADVGVFHQNMHRYTYRWYVEGAPLSAYSAPQNMPTFWNNPNQSWGKRAAFVLPYRAAPYRIWLIASDANQDYQLASVTIQTVDKNTTYAGTATIAFSSAGNFTDAPAGAQQVTTLSALEAAVQAATVPTRVSFRRGETHTGVDFITKSSTGSSTGQLQHMDTFATGTKPVLRPLEFDRSNMWTWRSSGPETQITIEDLKIEGYWDPTTETGSLGGASPFYWRDKTVSAVILLSNVEITNCEELQASANAAACDVFIHNTIIHNFQNYGVFAARNRGGKYIFLGSRIAQNPDALNGGPKKELSNHHGPIRITRCDWIVGDVMDLFSNDGWSGNFDCQPCLRVGTDTTDTTDIFMHWGRSVMENGYQIINLEGENSSAEDNPGNFVFDRLLLISGARQLAKMVSIHKGGTTIRNVLAWMPNVSGYTGGAAEFFDFDANNSQNGNDAAPVSIYNVTAISQQVAANEDSGPMTLIGGTGTFSDFTNGNNVLHIPDGSVPATGDAPLSLTAIPGVTTRNKGVQFNYEILNQTMTAVPNGGTLSISYADLLIRSMTGDGPGTATDQSYWTAISGTDTKHGISIGSSGTYTSYRSENGDFTVSFGASSVTITNTSGVSWDGPEFWLHLDRKSLLDSELPLQTAFATPDDVPQTRPQAGSAALGSASGLMALTDFEGDYRPISGVDRGAWQGAAA